MKEPCFKKKKKKEEKEKKEKEEEEKDKKEKKKKKGLKSDVRSTRGLFMILSSTRQIGSEVQDPMLEQDTTEFPVSLIMVMRRGFPQQLAISG